MRKIPLLLIAFIPLISCQMVINTALKSKGVYEKKINYHKLHTLDKEVLLIPNKHMGPPKYYENLRMAIDSLIKEDYYVFYESLKPGELKSAEDSSEFRTQVMKLRKILGKSLSSNSSDGGIFDTINNTIRIGKNTVKLKEKLMSQPSANYFFKNTGDYEKVDLTITELIAEFENRYGEIVLTNCDYTTPMDSEYKCWETDEVEIVGNMYDEIIVDYRNRYLVQEILKDKHPKIAVIYGANHMEGIIELLEIKGYQKTE